MNENRVSNWKGGPMRLWAMVTTAAMLACLAAVARGQQCDTHDQCMTDGMCMPDGTCQGTPVTGGSCDLISDVLCMVNGHCVNGACMGDQAPDGTSCAGGCGTCQPLFPGVPFSTCTAIPAQLGMACATNLGACFTGVCEQIGQPPNAIAECLPQLKQCPDVDNNPCTTDACNPATGMCVHSNAPPCVPQCETCNSATGQCEPTNLGAACSSGLSSECPVATSCQVLEGRGLCLAGTPSSAAPTPTATPTPTLTPVPTLPPGMCIGDCDDSGDVTVNELVTLVNIALDNADVSACPHGVPSGSSVDIALIIKAVGYALAMCPAA